ncbi:MAG TPA: histidine kinase [Cytophagales bacterium]|nr:histidine kinase [Cytophagales bacterium]
MIRRTKDLHILLLAKENEIIQHILFWFIILLVVIIFKEYPQWLNGIEVICFLIQFLAQMAIPGYFHNSFILPLFKKKKFALGLVLFVIELSIFVFTIPYILNSISWVFHVLFQMGNWVKWENENLAANIFSFIVMASVINLARERLLLQKEQKEAELRQLKEQLNPHFLFNTLNNLYGLSVIKSDKLPGLMLKLSDLLRYSLYETNRQFVSLEKELIYIKNYIELEEIRLSERAVIEFNTSGNFSNHSIAPLMLIVFVENSFKHHSSKRNEIGIIRLDFKVEENIFEMNLMNSVDSTVELKERKVGGIGLLNVRKRLDLIYGEKHSLQIDQQPEFCKVNLKICLN